jgi:hypothetical protein
VTRRLTRAAWRGLGWPERLVPTATRDGGERELNSEVDSVLKGSNGGAGELHGNKTKLLEGLVWIRKWWANCPRRRGATAMEFNGGGVLVAGVQEGGEEVARKLLRVDVVLVVSSVRSKRGRSGRTTVKSIDNGGQNGWRGVLVARA